MAGQPGAWRLGHGLLLGKGLAAWLAVCTATLSTTATAPSSRGTATAATTSTAAPGGTPAAALVSVLAQMTLAHC